MFPIRFSHSLEISLEAPGLLEAEGIRAVPGAIGQPCWPHRRLHAPRPWLRHSTHSMGKRCRSETAPDTQAFLLSQPRSLFPTGRMLLASHGSGWLGPVALDLPTRSPFSLAPAERMEAGGGLGGRSS